MTNDIFSKVRISGYTPVLTLGGPELGVERAGGGAAGGGCGGGAGFAL